MGRIITPESADPVTVMARLFDTHADVIFSYAERRVGATTAHEVVGDVFLIALDRLSTFDPTLGTERGWLYGIANNVLRRHWRSESRRLRAQARHQALAGVRDDDLTVEENRIDARSAITRVIDLVTAMPTGDRELLVMFAWEQLSYREIADVLAVPIGTVRSRLHRIRLQLADQREEGRR